MEIEGRRLLLPGKARGRAVAVQHGGAHGECVPGAAVSREPLAFSPAAESFAREKPELSVPVCPRGWESAPGLSSSGAAAALVPVLLLLGAVIVIYISLYIYVYLCVCVDTEYAHIYAYMCVFLCEYI